MKQSNWILGIGIFVAIVLIAGSLWMNLSTEEPANAGNEKPETEIGQTLNSVQFIPLSSLSRIIQKIM